MGQRDVILRLSAVALVVLMILLGGHKFVPFLAPLVLAHCDTMSGPGIKDAQQALETKNVDQVLKWVEQKDEPGIRQAFERTLVVRKLSEQARELADMYFFETLVRIHRAGEGAPYTGIKPAGSEVEPGIEAADKAVESGSVDELMADVSAQIAGGIRERFRAVMEKRGHSSDSVEAGREYVKAYITFIHYVENLHLAIVGQGAHGEEPTPAASHKHWSFG